MEETKINENERRILEFFAADYDPEEPAAYYFKGIIAHTGLDLKQVKRACRSLKKKGLAVYMRGLFDEDGKVAGSGYGASEEGYKLIGEKLPL